MPDWLQALQAVILSLVPIFGGYLVYKQSQESALTKQLGLDLTEAKTDVNTLKNENVALRSQQHKNMSEIRTLKDNEAETARKVKATNEENARLSEKLEQVTRERDEDRKALGEVRLTLTQVQGDHKTALDKAANEKRLDAALIEGLRHELESAHRDTDEARRQTAKYQAITEQQRTTIELLEERVKKLENKTAPLPDLSVNGDDPPASNA